MKYAILAVLAAFAGFVGAWLLFDSTVSVPVTSHREVAVPDLVTNLDPIGKNAEQSGTITFDEIRSQSSVFRQLLGAWQLAAQSDIPALESLIQKCAAESDPLYRQNIAGIFIERYVELDPAAAMDFVTSEHRLDQASMQGHVLTSWVRYDPEAALDHFRNLSDRRLKSTIGIRLLQDPVLARTGLDREVEAELGPMADQLRERIAMQQTDPETLFENAVTLTGHDRRSQMMYAINRWVGIAPEAALARVQNLPEGRDRDSLMQVAISRYAQRDPDAALSYVRLHAPNDVGLQTQVIGVMAQHDIDQALAAAEELNRRSPNSGVMQTVISTWAHNDPPAALDYVETLPGDERRSLYNNVAFTYIQQHPREGLEWALSLPAEFDDVRRSVLHNLSSENIDIAERALSRTNEQRLRNYLLTSIAQYKAKSDPDAALSWLSDYQREPAYVQAYRNVVSNLAQHAPERAAEMISAEGSSELAALLPAVAHHWYREDPDLALDWMRTIPSEEGRQAVIGSIAPMIAHEDPDTALELVSALPEDRTRNGVLQSIGYSWVQRDPDNVESIINRLGLSGEQADNLRQMATNPTGRTSSTFVRGN